MPLTKEQEAQLAQLQEEAKRPEPRTETGLAGLLHTVLDVVSGVRAHLPGDAWVALHSVVEHELGQPEGKADDEGQADDDEGSADPPKQGASSSSSSSKSKPKA